MKTIYDQFPDYDDFDEESQQNMQARFKSGTFLSFDELQKGVIGKDPFEKIRTHKTFDEISEEIAMSSPFGEESSFYPATKKYYEGRIYEIPKN